MARPSAVSTNAASPCPTSRNVTRNVPAAGRSRGDQTQSSNTPPANAPASRPDPHRHQIKATPSSRKKPATCQTGREPTLTPPPPTPPHPRTPPPPPPPPAPPPPAPPPPPPP